MFELYFRPSEIRSVYRRYDAIRTELRETLREFPSPYSYEERVTGALAGKINFPDALFLYALLRRYRPASILEIGSFLGFSTRWFLEIASEWNATVTSLDPNIRHRIFDRPQDILRRYNASFKNLEIVEAFFGPCGDCVQSDYATYEPRISEAEADRIIRSRPVLDGSWERRFDFIFIDGDHTEEAVERDFRNAYRLLNPRGVIAFHDVLQWEGVARVLERLKHEFRGQADVHIYGRVEQALLRPFHKVFGGIGSFKLRGNASGRARQSSAAVAGAG